jgi:1-deoxy-D-xylulose-5-phosphate reductoisomerase
VVGSTGSIGTQALDIVRDCPDRFKLEAIGAHSSVDTLLAQAHEFRPRIVALANESKAEQLKAQLPDGVELRTGKAALAGIATEADVVVNGVTGFAGLPVTLGALNAGKRLALANKESLIAAGPLVRKACETPGADLIPVDSEHGALHQCLRSETDKGAGDQRHVAKLIVTASGGPFRGRSLDDLRDVTVDEALQHPTWKMGPKITIDSSTLFNKGLEVLEAHELFDIDFDRIEVVVHPETIIHSAVEFTDGSVIAQLSKPDMRLPIGYAMGYPERLSQPYGAMSLAGVGALHFEAPDLDTFRCLGLAFDAGRLGGTAPAWLNAANEVAVAAFLNHEVTWLQISSIIESVLESYDGTAADSLEAVVEADTQARDRARAMVNKFQKDC